MMRFTRLGVLYLIFSSFHSLSAQIAPVPFSERVQEASHIVIGRVINQNAYWDEGRKGIYTGNEIEIKSYLKGYLPDDRLLIISPGGLVGDTLQIVTPSVDVKPDQEYLFMLDADAAGRQNKSYQATHPDRLQATVTASIQGSLIRQKGWYIDFAFQERLTEKELVNRVSALTGETPLKPNGQPYLAETNTEKYKGLPETASISSLENGAGQSTSNFQSGVHDTDKEMIINGSGFGTDQGTVEFANADNGGASNISSSVDSDYISWSDTEIRIKVPRAAGTGTMNVLDDGGANVGSTSVTIDWAGSSYASDFSGFSEDTRQNLKFLALNTQCGGYVFVYNNSQGPSGGFAGDTDAKGAFQRAMASWRCGTFVNFSIHPGSTNIGLASDGNCIVMYDNSLPTGVLGRTTRYFTGVANMSGCNLHNTLWYDYDIDLQFQEIPYPGYTWCFSGSVQNSEFDFETVALHELGHGHGLGHIIDNTKTMHYASQNGVANRTLSAQEVAAGNFKMDLPTNCHAPLNRTPMTDLTFGNCGIANIVCTVLPVELIAFNVKRNDNYSILSWTTAIEENNRRFIIERSGETLIWEKIGEVAGKGTTSQIQHYSFTDLQPFLAKTTIDCGKKIGMDNSATPLSDPSCFNQKPGLPYTQILWKTRRYKSFSRKQPKLKLSTCNSLVLQDNWFGKVKQTI